MSMRRSLHGPTGALSAALCVMVVVVACAAGLATGCGGSAPPPAAPLTEDDLLGTWLGAPEHDGRQGRFGVEFFRHDDGSLIAAMYLPDLDVWRLPAWPVKLEGNRVDMGGTGLDYDRSEPRLTGVMPAGLVPVHEIALELRPVDRIPRPEPIDPMLPEQAPLWSFDTGAPIWAGLSYADGVVYAGNDDGQVYALDASTGAEAWRLSTGGAIRARPTVDDDSLLAHSDDGYLYRIDRRSGAVTWRVRLGPPLERHGYGDREYRYDGYASAAVVADGRIYVSHDGGILLALDASNGSKVWELPPTT